MGCIAYTSEAHATSIFRVRSDWDEDSVRLNQQNDRMVVSHNNRRVERRQSLVWANRNSEYGILGKPFHGPPQRGRYIFFNGH
jgi:hypothetical protein